MTDIRLPFLRQLHRQLIQSREVITRIRDLPRLETQPSDHLKNGIEVYAFFAGWVGVVESEDDER